MRLDKGSNCFGEISVLTQKTLHGSVFQLYVQHKGDDRRIKMKQILDARKMIRDDIDTFTSVS